MKWLWLWPLLGVAGIFYVTFGIGRSVGRVQGHEERCCEGETQPCVFGPGIVGMRRCHYVWGDCEPDPRFRVPPEGSAR